MAASDPGLRNRQRKGIISMSKDAFAFWDRNGKLTYNEGPVRIYNVDGEDYLFVGPVMYASTIERDWYGRNVYPRARGKCLEIGLGLGVASKVILANKRVRHLLTIEKQAEVIQAFGRPLPRHNILEKNVYEWIVGVAESVDLFEPFYDFIFVDHYTDMEEDYDDLKNLQEMLLPLLKQNGSLVFWIDENAPEEDQCLIRSLWI